MISYLKGTLEALEEDKVVIDVGGIGYGVFMSVAMLVVETFSVIYYVPVLLIAGMLTGLLIGIVSNEMLKRLVNIQL